MKKLFYILIIIIFCTFLYAKYIEPNNISIKEYSIYSENLPNGFDSYKIVQFSDTLINNDTDLNLLTKTVNQINEQNPDVVVFTGDLLKKKVNKTNKNKIIKLLKKINVNYKKFAILGDKDTTISEEIFNEANFTILDNTSELIFNNDNNPITISGGNKITNEIINNTYEKKFNIILIHKPDDFDNLNIDGYSLVLAGHSLGGQIRVPFYGPINRKKGAEKYINNYYKTDNKELYVSFGIGYDKYNIRLLDNPTIYIYRLYTK